ncbi:MAG TPA: outer membrane beta-barrel protein [Longimicrobium sp.]|nr:outer membrane beta-barrel protein [Longimicrobium sp.]
MKVATLVTIGAVAAALTAGSASAQAVTDRSSTRGLGVGLSFNQSAVGVDAPREANTGSGVGVAIGYGVNDNLSFFARTNYAYRSSHLDAGVRYSFGSPRAALRPYAELAATRVGTSAAEGFRSSGYGATAGVGVEYFLNRNLALDVGVVHSEGRYTSREVAGAPVEGSSRFMSSRLNIGLKWHP